MTVQQSDQKLSQGSFRSSDFVHLVFKMTLFEAGWYVSPDPPSICLSKLYPTLYSRRNIRDIVAIAGEED